MMNSSNNSNNSSSLGHDLNQNANRRPQMIDLPRTTSYSTLSDRTTHVATPMLAPPQPPPVPLATSTPSTPTWVTPPTSPTITVRIPSSESSITLSLASFRLTQEMKRVTFKEPDDEQSK